MLLTEDQYEKVILGKKRRVNPLLAAFRNGMAEEGNQWPGGIIPVDFDESISEL